MDDIKEIASWRRRRRAQPSVVRPPVYEGHTVLTTRMGVFRQCSRFSHVSSYRLSAAAGPIPSSAHPSECPSAHPSLSLSLSVRSFVRSFVCHNIHRTLSLSSQQFLFPLTFWHSNSDSKPTNVTSVQDAQLEPSLFRLIALTIFALALPFGIAAVVRCETTYRAPPLPVKHCFKESHILIHPLILPPSPSQL